VREVDSEGERRIGGKWGKESSDEGYVARRNAETQEDPKSLEIRLRSRFYLRAELARQEEVMRYADSKGARGHEPRPPERNCNPLGESGKHPYFRSI